MGTDNNIPLKGINNVFHSSLFEGISPVLIEFTVNLLNEHKSLFLFGTNGNKDLNEYSKDNIYINTLINNLINKLSSISSLKVHSLFLNKSLEQILYTFLLLIMLGLISIRCQIKRLTVN